MTNWPLQIGSLIIVALASYGIYCTVFDLHTPTKRTEEFRGLVGTKAARWIAGIAYAIFVILGLLVFAGMVQR
jgi:hypothetical protein